MGDEKKLPLLPTATRDVSLSPSLPAAAAGPREVPADDRMAAVWHNFLRPVVLYLVVFSLVTVAWLIASAVKSERLAQWCGGQYDAVSCFVLVTAEFPLAVVVSVLLVVWLLVTWPCSRRELRSYWPADAEFTRPRSVRVFWYAYAACLLIANSMVYVRLVTRVSDGTESPLLYVSDGCHVLLWSLVLVCATVSAQQGVVLPAFLDVYFVVNAVTTIIRAAEVLSHLADADGDTVNHSNANDTGGIVPLPSVGLQYYYLVSWFMSVPLVLLTVYARLRSDIITLNHLRPAVPPVSPPEPPSLVGLLWDATNRVPKFRWLMAGAFLVCAAQTVVLYPIILLTADLSSGVVAGDANGAESYVAIKCLVYLAWTSLNSTLLQSLRLLLVNAAGERLSLEFKAAIFERLLVRDPSYFKLLDCEPSNITSHLSTCRGLAAAMTDAATTFAVNAMQVVAGVIIGITISGPLTGALLASELWLGVFVIFRSIFITTPRSADYSKCGGRETAKVDDVLKGISTVQQYQAEPHELRELRHNLLMTSASGWRRFLADIVVRGIEQLLVNTIYGIGFYLGTLQVIRGSLSVVELVAYCIVSSRVVTFFGQGLQSIGDMAGQIGAAYRILGLLALSEQPDRLLDVAPQAIPRGSEIEFRNVTYCYAKAAAPTLVDVSFTFHAGESIGLVGKTGSGKSTILMLIRGLLKLSDSPSCRGHILIDGKDVTTLNHHDLAGKITFLPQEPYLFDHTIGYNIEYGRLHNPASVSELMEAATAANAQDFIRQDTLRNRTGLAGRDLSGGQRQRVALARVFLRSPSVLLVDEPTSALDPETSREVVQALHGVVKKCGATFFLSAQRLNTLQDMSKFVFCDRQTHSARVVTVEELGRSGFDLKSD